MIRPSAVAVAVFAVFLYAVALAAFDVQGVTYLGGWLAFALIGAFLAERRPRNAIGWLFALIGVSSLIGFVAEEQRGILAVFLPDRVIAGLAGSWFVSFSLPPALLILFPDGRPPSRRWWIALAALAISVPIGVLSSSSGEPADAAITPVLIALLGEEGGVAAASEMQVVAALGPLFVMLGVLALVVRGRGGDRVQRQQLKWFTYAAALLGIVFVATYAIYVSPLRALDPGAPYPVALFGGVPFVIGLVSIPVAATIAILRHRLYDIDVVINRTIVYAVLTLLLAGMYVMTVLAAQRALGAFTGGNEAAVAGSTLLVVALFQPLRRRIQDAVDRRFYRSRYDAQRALDVFAQRLRDEVDLVDLERELVGVVSETIRPAHASLWLRDGRT